MIFAIVQSGNPNPIFCKQNGLPKEKNGFLRYKCKKIPRKRGIDGKISSHGVMKVHSITDALILPRKAHTCQ